MLIRAALALLLLLSTAASAQDLDTAVSAVVRISGTRNGTPVRGTGFVVGLDRDKATIVTASHVIEGVQQLEVTFVVDSSASFPAGAVLGMDAGSPNGLAVFQVRGVLPAGVTTLIFDIESRPRLGEALFLLGVPQMELTPRTTQRVLSARRGTLLVVDQEIGEGFSGAPVLQGGKVVGVVTAMDGQTTYAVNSVVAHEALEGWGVKLGGERGTPVPSTATSTKPAPTTLRACTPGEERTESGMVYVRLCAGTFTMGSAENDSQAYVLEKPAHQVTLSEFWIGKTEITNEQYRRFRPDHRGKASLPVTNVSWTEAQETCEHFGGRLPTEAEWEYAARAGSKTAWSFGATAEMISDYAWYRGNTHDAPRSVGTKKANAVGLCDMYGNVWEWVADWYDDYSSLAQTDPSGPAAGKYRVLRGGAYYDEPRDMRSANRFFNIPDNPGKSVGFRCAHSLRRQS